MCIVYMTRIVYLLFLFLIGDDFINNLSLTENIKTEDLIYEIRGKQVMLDSDLAKLYKCKNGTKEINQAVKNNLEKFSK